VALLSRSNVVSVLLYGFVGGSAFVIDLGTLIFLRDVTSAPLPLATAVSLVAGLAASYTLQRFLTFRRNTVTWHSLWKYGVLVTFNWVATTAIIHGIETAGVSYVVGKFGSTAVITCWNYFIYRFWIFRSAPEVSSLEPAGATPPPEPAADQGPVDGSSARAED
jgi:putative flippase GtrA